MFYRENGQFKTTYSKDQQIFPILQDRIAILAIVAFAFIAVPFIADEYMFRAILIPFLILSLAAIGVNILVGYCGQISLGSGGFMAVGAYAAYNTFVRIDGMPLIVALLVGGVQRNLQRYAFEASAFSAKPSFPGAAIGGWYYNPATPGTGVFTERQGDQVFAAYFYYRADGSPAWSVLNGKNWLPTSNGSFSGNALPFVNYVNGQTLLGGYVLPTAVANDTKAFLSVDSGGGFTVFNGVVNRAETWSKFKF